MNDVHFFTNFFTFEEKAKKQTKNEDFLKLVPTGQKTRGNLDSHMNSFGIGYWIRLER